MNHTDKEIVHYEKASKLFAVNSYQTNGHRTSPHSKRVFDVVVALLVTVLFLSWILPILALLIKLNSRGPVFFLQKRIGLFGRPFTCIKLRTMVVNKDANSLQAKTNDPRITSFGKFLRLSCFDELPQFFNVLFGQMSVVGPRPHMITDCKKFEQAIENYNLRNQVKPGITGMAQVKGYRGHTEDFYDMAHRYKWDIFYIRNLSFRLDMKIIRLTISSTLKAIFIKLLSPAQTQQKITYQFEAPEYLN